MVQKLFPQAASRLWWLVQKLSPQAANACACGAEIVSTGCQQALWAVEGSRACFQAGAKAASTGSQQGLWLTGHSFWQNASTACQEALWLLQNRLPTGWEEASEASLGCLQAAEASLSSQQAQNPKL